MWRTWRQSVTRAARCLTAIDFYPGRIVIFIPEFEFAVTIDILTGLHAIPGRSRIILRGQLAPNNFSRQQLRANVGGVTEIFHFFMAFGAGKTIAHCAASQMDGMSADALEGGGFISLQIFGRSASLVIGTAVTGGATFGRLRMASIARAF